MNTFYTGMEVNINVQSVYIVSQYLQLTFHIQHEDEKHTSNSYCSLASERGNKSLLISLSVLISSPEDLSNPRVRLTFFIPYY